MPITATSTILGRIGAIASSIGGTEVSKPAGVKRVAEN